MPGASAIGMLAATPINTEQIAATIAVAAMALSNGIPAACRMPGFANRMYAIVRNVASAPRSSRVTVVPRASRSKKVESMTDDEIAG